MATGKRRSATEVAEALGISMVADSVMVGTCRICLWPGSELAVLMLSSATSSVRSLTSTGSCRCSRHDKIEVGRHLLAIHV